MLFDGLSEALSDGLDSQADVYEAQVIRLWLPQAITAGCD